MSFSSDFEAAAEQRRRLLTRIAGLLPSAIAVQLIVDAVRTMIRIGLG